MNSVHLIRPLATSLLFCVALPPGAWAQQGSGAIDGPPNLTTSELTFMLRQQEKRFEARFEEQAAALAEQRKLIDAQQTTLESQTAAIRSLQARIAKAETSKPEPAAGGSDQGQQLAAQREAIATQTAAIQALQTQFDQFSQEQRQSLSTADQQIRARLDTLETSVRSETAEETTTTYDASQFPGAIQVPGMPAAIRVGGFAKAAVVQNLDGALEDQNSFIVGSIPTTGPNSGDEQATLNVRQSRLNVEYRQETTKGQLRAYIEGDFAGNSDQSNNDLFRLRQAFGQFGDMLAGKYWSNFMDVEASPEEIDFEGVNGRINVRQTQFRWFPELGKGWNLILSLENTQPEITGGNGLSRYPDFVASFRRVVRNHWNVKFSALLRSLEARWTTDEAVKDDDIGWGFSISGKRTVNWWDPRDNVIVQLNYGEGYGRYVNDLNSVGGQDAVFSDTGDLKLLPVFAGYVGFQKWWRDGLRSNMVVSVVEIDNYDFQPGDAYDSTWRVSTNLFWSPIPEIDVGGELLFGGREDKDGTKGEASQFQFAVRYRF